MVKTIEITIPEEVKTIVQRANIERDSRRDILLYIMSHEDINISQERIDLYQRQYDEKYFQFEQAKKNIEQIYVYPATNGKAIDWSLDYNTNIITINVED